MARKKKRDEALDNIFLELYSIGRRLMRGGAMFKYSPLASAMKWGHPGNILISEIDRIWLGRSEISTEELNEFREFLEGMIEEFDIFEIQDPLDELDNYITKRQNAELPSD